MIDLCTVVTQANLSILKLQAASVGLYTRSVGVRNIYVVLNDDNETLASKIDLRWWGQMTKHVTVIPRTVFSAAWVPNANNCARVWRFLCASLSNNVLTCVLDVNTVLTKPMSIKSLIDSATGKILSGRQPATTDLVQSMDMIADLYPGIEFEVLGPGAGIGLLHNDTVRAMITDLNFRTRRNFSEWLQHLPDLDETVLYSAFCQQRYGSLSSLYSEQTLLQPCFATEQHRDTMDQMLDNFATQSVTSVGIASAVWQNMNSDQRQRYRMLLIDHGILRTWDLA